MANETWDDSFAKAFGALMRFLTALTRPPALYVIAAIAIVWMISSGRADEGVVSRLFDSVGRLLSSLAPAVTP